MIFATRTTSLRPCWGPRTVTKHWSVGGRGNENYSGRLRQGIDWVPSGHPVKNALFKAAAGASHGLPKIICAFGASCPSASLACAALTQLSTSAARRSKSPGGIHGGDVGTWGGGQHDECFTCKPCPREGWAVAKRGALFRGRTLAVQLRPAFCPSQIKHAILSAHLATHVAREDSPKESTQGHLSKGLEGWLHSGPQSKG
jgi:hypothetical protein